MNIFVLQKLVEYRVEKNLRNDLGLLVGFQLAIRLIRKKKEMGLKCVLFHSAVEHT